MPTNLWKHQVEAIRAWENNDRRGLISMATGTGKTLAALVAAQRCPELRLLVIAVPRLVLVDQWASEASHHTQFPKPILVHESAANWQEPLFNRLRGSRWRANGDPVFVIGTLQSLSKPHFASVLADADVFGQSLLIVDEVHHAGAPTYRSVLQDQFHWRLGLSATPARYFDEEGTQIIQEYFGPTVYVYDLRHALQDGYLCPYHYFVYAAHLTKEEFKKYLHLTEKILHLRGKSVAEALTLESHNIVDSDSEEIKQLLFNRARILKKCSSKLCALERALNDHPLKRCLIYCADNEQLDDVTNMLKRKHILHLRYTAATPTESRCSALQALGAGYVPVLAAIDCLDEGVDIPAVNEALIMASSSNKRQFIQRRGRILRKAPGKSFAKLIDIVVLPPLSSGPDARWMLNGELARIKEMAELAENKHDALLRVKQYAAPYGVLLSQLLSGEGDG
jgi:superfamily II DNA or RNA helicase